MRRVWVGLLVTAWAGAAAAQQPAAPPAPEVILVQKTAGQPDRKLKLLKMVSAADGERFADVQDVASGARYQLPAAALGGMTRAAADPAPLPAARPTGSGGRFPTSLPLPAPTPGGSSPYTSRPLPAAAPPPERPRPTALDTPITALVGDPPLVAGDPPPVAAAPPTLPAPTRAAPAGPPPAPPTTLVGLVRQQFEAGRPAQPPAVPPPLLRPRPAPPAVVPAAAVEPTALPQPMPPAPAPTPPEPPTIQSANFQVPTTATWPLTRAEQMRAETEQAAHDLVYALRPTVRERAATALAGGRHASHPEVKRLLAQVAAADPAPGVQAHCVRILSALGYHAPDHVEFLEVALGSDHPGLRQAAAAALAKLTPQ